MELIGGHLYAPSPQAALGELTEVAATGRSVRIERIVSLGQATAPDFWYDQAQHEFVALLAGAARLAIEGEAQARSLVPGDWVVLPAHCRHRVEWTDPGQPTVWLAVFYDAME